MTDTNPEEMSIEEQVAYMQKRISEACSHTICEDYPDKLEKFKNEIHRRLDALEQQEGEIYGYIQFPDGRIVSRDINGKWPIYIEDGQLFLKSTLKLVPCVRVTYLMEDMEDMEVVDGSLPETLL